MLLFFQCIVVAIAIFVILISINEKKCPKGLIEWLFIIGAFVVLIVWSAKY